MRNGRSPFARKVRVAACELGVDNEIELTETNPWTDERLRRLNPLSKVPTFVTADSVVLYESGVICEYLDALKDPPRLFPPKGPARWHALLLQGLADGASTAAGRLFADEHRPADQRAPTMMARFSAALAASLDKLETEALAEERPAIGEIAVAVFLGYLDFRWPDRNWRAERPKLAGWFARMGERRSMTDTQHHLPTGAAHG